MACPCRLASRRPFKGSGHHLPLRLQGCRSGRVRGMLLRAICQRGDSFRESTGCARAGTSPAGTGRSSQGRCSLKNLSYPVWRCRVWAIYVRDNPPGTCPICRHGQGQVSRDSSRSSVGHRIHRWGVRLQPQPDSGWQADCRSLRPTPATPRCTQCFPAHGDDSILALPDSILMVTGPSDPSTENSESCPSGAMYSPSGACTSSLSAPPPPRDRRYSGTAARTA